MPERTQSTVFRKTPLSFRPADADPEPRKRVRTSFLKSCDWGDVEPVPLAGDASFRRYYRLQRGDRRVVVMDAPPPQEDIAPYVSVSRLLRNLGLSAPEVFTADSKHGFLLIEDFGDDTYTRLLESGADEWALYTLAVDTLIELQHAAKQRTSLGLPPYDMARLLAEASLLVDWYAPAALRSALPEAVRAEYLALWRALLPQATVARPTLVLRDYHVDNLMLLADRPSVRRCGLLDFQDAVCGPPSYDLVSLLEDARRDVPAELRQAMTGRYLAAFPQYDRADFARSAAILAAQRNCKILGIFTRLWQRDGKPQYLAHIPRLWRLLEEDLAHPVLTPMRQWLDRYLPPAARQIAHARNAA